MVVYRLFCRVTGKSYIGATRKSVIRRITNHRARANDTGLKGMYPLSQAIREHGWESFNVSILAHASSFAELVEMEKAAITLHKSVHPNGYNLLAGGQGLTIPPTTGKPAWNRGVPHTAIAKARMSAARLGTKNYRARAIEYRGVQYGCIKDCCEATGMTREQIDRRLRKGMAMHLTPAIPVNRKAFAPVTAKTRQRMSASHLGSKHYRARRIMVDGKEYTSIKDAEGVSGYTRQQLKLRLKDGRAAYLSESRYLSQEK